MSTNLQSVLSDCEYKNWLRAGLSLKYARQGILNLVKNDIDSFHQDVLKLLAGSQCNSCQIIQTKGVFSIRCQNSVCDKILIAISNEHRFKPAWKNTDCQMWCNQAWQLAKCYMSPGYASKVSAADTDFPGLVSVIINNKRFDNLVNDNMGSKTNIFCQARDVRNTILHKADMRVTDTDLADYIQTLQTMLSDPKCSTTDTDILNAQARLTEIQNGSLFVTTEDIDQIKAEACRALEEKKQEALSAVTKSKEEAEIAIKQTADNACIASQKVIEGQMHKAMSDISSTADVNVKKQREEDINQNAKKDMKAQLISRYQQDEQLSAPLFPLVLNDYQKDIEELYVKPFMKHKDKTIDSYKDIFKDERKKIYVVGDAGLGKTSLCQKMVSTWCRVQSKLVEKMSEDEQPIVQQESNLSEIVEDMSDDKQPMVQKESNLSKNTGLGKTSCFQKYFCCFQSETVEERSDEEQPMVLQESNLPLDKKVTDGRHLAEKKKCSDDKDIRKDNEQPMVLQETNLSQDKKVTDGSHFAEQNKSSDDDDDTRSAFDDDSCGISDDDSWCISDDERLSEKDIGIDDEQTMREFDFLFYISLREADKENDVEDMIKYQLLSEEFHEHLPTVLKEEKFLIILDGLDEWYGDSTDQRRTGRLVNKGIPAIRTMMKNGTILTTTRPWKLEAIQLKSTQIDAKIELLGIETVSSEKLIQLMLYHLNKENNRQMEMKDFVSELKDKKLEHFMAIPVILKQLICLWHSGKKLGPNKTTIYCQMVELLFELGQTRLYQDPKLQYENKKEKWMKSPILLPDCFDKNYQCHDHKPLLNGLSKVAFKTLLFENQESSLVFKRSQAEIHGMTAEDINICLKIGILSQSGVIKNCMSHIHISFLHKTYQEFFAALFVSVHPTESDQSVQTIQDVCNSEDKCLEMQTMITFISGMSSEITCKLMTHIKPLLSEYEYTVQYYLCKCLQEGWHCNHGNIHLQCDSIAIYTSHQPEHLELQCQANIHHMKRLWLNSHPTARCLEHLLQVDTLEKLLIGEPSISNHYHISEDNLYSIIQHNTHTLTELIIACMTLRSTTKLYKLLYNIHHLSKFYMYSSTMSQQLLDSLQEFEAQRPDILVIIDDLQ